ncbi:hypothetical protein AYO20_10986 [Fonsecaea nubica]|uniref:BTB domain-containing protein n=1 Tax=Fonsecaea nubica TaxID=856822 RepID=A0A178C448_9EURO|nr:hypothetical protein AYO20_10986 [Fonsecaea nubica]OAL23541.1 hypothetical protein AYO20_10986 [Fonsecaea nubica]
MSNLWAKPTLTAEERARRYNQEALLAYSDGSINGDEANDSTSRSRVPRYSFPQPKRRKTSTTVTAEQTSSLESPNMSTSSSPAPVRIKREAEAQALEKLQQKPPEQRVKVYVGKNNTEMEVSLEDLEKAPVLKCLISKLGTPSPYIMHPGLMAVDADQFRAVREFLLTDEYMPALVNHPHGENVLPKQLDNCATVDHYRNEALRSGKLYVIAEKLGMKSLQDLVFRKITQAQFHPYGPQCLLDLAMIIFSRPEAGDLNPTENPNKSEGELEGIGENEQGDVLEEWLIKSIRDQFQRTMIHHSRHFFRVSEHGVCRKRAFGPRVLRSKVEDWEALDPDVVAIEDDD